MWLVKKDCFGVFSDSRHSCAFLPQQREKNKELEARARESERKLAEEKVLRESAEAKTRALRKKLRALKEEMAGGATGDLEQVTKEEAMVRKSRSDSEEIDYDLDVATTGSGDNLSIGLHVEKRTTSASRPTSPTLETKSVCSAPQTSASARKAALMDPAATSPQPRKESTSPQPRRGSTSPQPRKLTTQAPQSGQNAHHPPLMPRKSVAPSNAPSHRATTGGSTGGRGASTVRGPTQNSSQPRTLTSGPSGPASSSPNKGMAGDAAMTGAGQPPSLSQPILPVLQKPSMVGAPRQESTGSQAGVRPASNDFDPHAPTTQGRADTGHQASEPATIHTVPSTSMLVMNPVMTNGQHTHMHVLNQQPMGASQGLQPETMHQPVMQQSSGFSDMNQPVLFVSQHPMGLMTTNPQNQFQSDPSHQRARGTSWPNRNQWIQQQQHSNASVQSDIMSRQSNAQQHTQQAHDPFDELVRRPNSNTQQNR